MHDEVCKTCKKPAAAMRVATHCVLGTQTVTKVSPVVTLQHCHFELRGLWCTAWLRFLNVCWLCSRTCALTCSAKDNLLVSGNSCVPCLIFPCGWVPCLITSSSGVHTVPSGSRSYGSTRGLGALETQRRWWYRRGTAWNEYVDKCWAISTWAEEQDNATWDMVRSRTALRFQLWLRKCDRVCIQAQGGYTTQKPALVTLRLQAHQPLEACHEDAIVREFRTLFRRAYDREPSHGHPPPSNVFNCIVKLREEPESEGGSSADEGVPGSGAGWHGSREPLLLGSGYTFGEFCDGQ